MVLEGAGMRLRKRELELTLKCDECGKAEEHTWRDSWTGRELCTECVRRATWATPPGM